MVAQAAWLDNLFFLALVLVQFCSAALRCLAVLRVSFLFVYLLCFAVGQESEEENPKSSKIRPPGSQQ